MHDPFASLRKAFNDMAKVLSVYFESAREAVYASMRIKGIPTRAVIRRKFHNNHKLDSVQTRRKALAKRHAVKQVHRAKGKRPVYREKK